MSIQLRLTHEEGIRLRQQTAHTVERTEGPERLVVAGKDWKFDKYQDATGKTTDECPQDEDNRRVGSDGKKLKLGTYTIHVTAGTRNLVVERKGKTKSFEFKNPAIRNQMRVKYQTLVEKLKDGKPVTQNGKPVHVWEDTPGQPQYIPPNSFGGVFVGDTQRAILDEMPT